MIGDRLRYTILTVPDLRELGRALEIALNALVDIENGEGKEPDVVAQDAIDKCEKILKGEF